MPACPSLLRLRGALCPALLLALGAGTSVGARAQGFETARLHGAAPGQSSGTFGPGAVSAPATAWAMPPRPSTRCTTAFA